MSYLPRMIYKGGRLNSKPANYTIVKDFSELMARVQEGFFPIGCENVKDMIKIPELSALVAEYENIEAVVEKTAELIEETKPVEVKPFKLKKRRARRTQ